MKMRKWILALAWLLASASAQAHVLAVPFPEVGSLQDAHKAAFAIFQTYSVPAIPQITCILATGVASVGGPCATPGSQPVCADNHVVVTRNVTMVNTPSPANRNLNVSVNTFSSGDVGKYIVVPGAAGGGAALETYITAFVDAQNVTLSIPATLPLSGVSTVLTYGADDSPLFKQFNTWAQANQGSSNQVILTLPTNGTCWFGSIQSISGTGLGNGTYFGGINNVILEANGSTLTDQDGSYGYNLGVFGICAAGLTQSNGCSARIKSVSAGASTIELTAASYATGTACPGSGYICRFSVNGWLMVGGIDTQSLWNSPYGYPPNPTYYEWRQITAICINTGPCAGTATLTLDRPLTNTYLDTWPSYNTGTTGGGCCEADPGGPATIWSIPSVWNSTAEFRNVTISQFQNTNTIRRNVTFRNMISAPYGGALTGPIPSQTENWSAYNSSFISMEADKIVGTFTLDTVTANIIHCQSRSIDTTFIRNSTFSNQLAGCGRRTEVTDSTMAALYVGPTSYGGGAETFICTRCNVASFSYGGSGYGHGPQSDYSMSGGVISFANTAVSGSDPASRIFSPLPGNLLYKVGGSFAGTIGLIRPTALTQDPTNTYVQTNEAGGFPTWSGGIVSMNVVPAAKFTNDNPNSASDPFFKANSLQNGCPALVPMNSCGATTYSPTGPGNLTSIAAMGKIVDLTIDVTTAATAVGSITVNPTAQFNQDTVKQSNWTGYNWLPVINLKVAGKRVYTNAGSGTGAWTCDTGGGPVAGGCSGDTVTGSGLPPEQVWIKDSIQPSVLGTISGGVTPTFKISIQTDQGVVP